MLAPSRLTFVRIRRLWIGRPKSMVAKPIMSSTGSTKANSISATPRLRREVGRLRTLFIEELVSVGHAGLHVDAVAEQERRDHGHRAFERVAGANPHVAAGAPGIPDRLPPG